MLNERAQRLLAAAAGSPAVFPCELDPDWVRVRCVELNADDYRMASFLDGRTTGGRDGVWIDADALWSEAAALPVRCHFIFHIGHVGSTLLSRLLGEDPRFFGVREPELLRRLVDGPASVSPDRLGALSDGMLRLLSRTWTPEQTAVVKATSFVGERAAELLHRAPASRAVLMSVNPLSYLRTILGGPASRIELQALTPLRWGRLQRRFAPWPTSVKILSLGEAAAASWLCESAALQAAAAAHPERVLWLDFDAFLADPGAGLFNVLEALGVRTPPGDVEALLSGPLMSRYSKGPEHPYDAALRAEVQRQAERDHGAEIHRGMEWLGAVATACPPVRAALEIAARSRHPA